MYRQLRGWAIGFTLAFGTVYSVLGQAGPEYDLVVAGGRVIDPETKLDTIKNVGIIGNRIAQISSAALRGRQVINASGLVVSPGFIDPHIHGISNKEQEYQLHDGLRAGSGCAVSGRVV
ncbi:hypothetical protein [Spirosoma panaciterrae]|uniref:hypothetical protein n=1 Tax=Spirosoma panaciterrae TaxID=496058 RepID=UPI0006868497|nr:hypothetical protein [Spirosoma panaciterrae]